MILESVGRDLFIQITNKDGVQSIEQRRVWDADRFMSSAHDQYKKEGCTVEVSTRTAYQEQRRNK